MKTALFTAIWTLALAASAPAETVRAAGGLAPQELSRVDPGKTLALIRRIKEAGGEAFAS